METNLEQDTTPRLIFDGKAWSPSRLRLAWFLLISLIGHLCVFYLFKVVTPLTTKRLPPEESVLVLRGEDPESAQILASLEDRSPAGMLVSLNLADAHDLPRLALSEYIPSFQGHQPDYKLDWEQPQEPLPKLAPSNQPRLPLIANKPPSARSRTQVQNVPLLTLTTELAARGLAESPHWPDGVMTSDEASEHIVIQICVDASGLVQYCLSEGSTLPASLMQALEQLRFNSKPQQMLQWGQVELSW